MPDATLMSSCRKTTRTRIAGLNTAQQVPEDAEALSFSDNAPSWPELSELVAKRSAELQWSLPDVESVLRRIPGLLRSHLTTLCMCYLSRWPCHAVELSLSSHGHPHVLCHQVPSLTGVIA